jgi:hypothetical protein
MANEPTASPKLEDSATSASGMLVTSMPVASQGASCRRPTIATDAAAPASAPTPSAEVMMPGPAALVWSTVNASRDREDGEDAQDDELAGCDGCNRRPRWIAEDHLQTLHRVRPGREPRDSCLMVKLLGDRQRQWQRVTVTLSPNLLLTVLTVRLSA